MMKYKCLVFDHDDTVVNSTANVHFPSFLAYLEKIGKPCDYTLEDYVRYNFDPGVLPFFKDICGLTDDQLKEEQEFWFDYTSKHVSEAFPGIREILERHVEEGGILTVISHSFSNNIIRDYQRNSLPMPCDIYGWEVPKDKRKPNPDCIYEIMKKHNLDKKDILVIDDLKPGLDMAKVAGVDFVAAGWCFNIEENEKYMRDNAEHYFKTVEELSRFLYESE